MRPGYTHTQREGHTQTVLKHTHFLLAFALDTQNRIHPPKQSFFERESGGLGWGGGVERSSLANVHNEKCKLCHFLQIKVF